MTAEGGWEVAERAERRRGAAAYFHQVPPVSLAFSEGEGIWIRTLWGGLLVPRVRSAPGRTTDFRAWRQERRGRTGPGVACDRSTSVWRRAVQEASASGARRRVASG